MIKVICDKCGADCDLNAYVLTVEVIHNPSPSYPLDRGRLKITDDGSYMRMCLCQKCYRKLGFPNIYKVIRTKKLDWTETEDVQEDLGESNAKTNQDNQRGIMVVSK